MGKKTFFTCCFMAVGSLIVFGQEFKSALDAPDNWRNELLAFPLEFAPEIDLVGFEDVLFAPGWADKTSDQFWMYHFTWFVDFKEPMSVSFLEKNLVEYYNGLANMVLKGNENEGPISIPDSSICLFIKTQTGFIGKMRVFDPFFTKDYIDLNVIVKESVCQKTEKHIVSFHISPKEVDHKIWEQFKNIKVLQECN